MKSHEIKAHEESLIQEISELTAKREDGTITEEDSRKLEELKVMFNEEHAKCEKRKKGVIGTIFQTLGLTGAILACIILTGCAMSSKERADLINNTVSLASRVAEKAATKAAEKLLEETEERTEKLLESVEKRIEESGVSEDVAKVLMEEARKHSDELIAAARAEAAELIAKAKEVTEEETEEFVDKVLPEADDSKSAGGIGATIMGLVLSGLQLAAGAAKL